MDVAGSRTLYSIFAAHARRRPDDLWLAFESETGQVQQWTFAQFLAAVHQAANFLKGKGIRLGDVVNLHLTNHVAYPQMILAASHLGAIVLPSNPACSADDIIYLLNHSETCLILTDSTHVEMLRGLAGGSKRTVLSILDYETELARQPATLPVGEGSTDRVVQYLYTSGTTSRPKGVMLTNANLIYGAEVLRAATGLRQEDHHYIALPLFHAAAQCHALWPSLVAGCRVTIAYRFSGSRFFERAAANRATMAALFGAPLRILLSQPDQPAQKQHRLRNVTFAQNLTEPQYEEWHRRFGAPLQQLWGMTETAGLPLMSPLTGERRLSAMGRPVVGYELKIVDEAGCEVPRGETGQLIVRGTPGRSLMLGYLKDAEATAKVLRRIDEDTWLFTGDTVRGDADDFVYFVDRGKDLIKRGGENISSSEVEGVISLLPQVADVAVIGIPDPIKDEAVTAVLVLKNGVKLDEEEVRAHCTRSLASFKVPEHVRFVEALPRTSVGKIQKQIIRGWFTEAS